MPNDSSARTPKRDSNSSRAAALQPKVNTCFSASSRPSTVSADLVASSGSWAHSMRSSASQPRKRVALIRLAATSVPPQPAAISSCQNGSM